MIESGVTVVLMVKDQMFYEIVKKEGERLELADVTGKTVSASVGQMFGYTPVQAVRVVKPGDERMYYSVGTPGARNHTGVTWYTKRGVYA